MNITQAINILMALITLSTRVVGMISTVTKIIKTAQAEGRNLTDAETKLIQGIDDTARKGLVDAIETAKAEGN